VAFSGTASASPRSLYAFPLLYQGELSGLMEVASFSGIDAGQREFLDAEALATLPQVRPDLMVMDLMSRRWTASRSWSSSGPSPQLRPSRCWCHGQGTHPGGPGPPGAPPYPAVRSEGEPEPGGVSGVHPPPPQDPGRARSSNAGVRPGAGESHPGGRGQP
jgi:hypothetical protein